MTQATHPYPGQAPTDSFDLGGSGGGNSFSFGPQGAQPGAHIAGTVLDMKEVQRTNFDTKKPEFWDNGDPKMQYRVTLQTELRDTTNPTDDGRRDLYLDGRRKPNDNGTKSRLCAVLDAVREVTGNTQLQRGGKLTVQWVSGMGFSGDPRNYAAWYEAPAMNLGGTPQPAAVAPASPPPPTPVQQQPAQPPQWAQSEQGAVDTSTGEVAQPAAPAPVAATHDGPTPEAIAALRAAGVDPATVYPSYTG